MGSFHILYALLLKSPLRAVTFYYLCKNPKKLQVTFLQGVDIFFTD